MSKHECCGTDKVTKVNQRDGTTLYLCADCLADVTCPGCGAIEGTSEWGTVGDGYDGYCPSCADKREAKEDADAEV